MVWNPNIPAAGAGLTSQPLRDNFDGLEVITYGGRGFLNSTNGKEIIFAEYGLNDLLHNKYHVSITLLGANDNIGKVYVANRGVSGFYVFNTGTDAQMPFTWALGRRS